MIDTYHFSGNFITYLGFFALFFTPILLFVIWRSWWRSPLNQKVKPKVEPSMPIAEVSQDSPTD